MIVKQPVTVNAIS